MKLEIGSGNTMTSGFIHTDMVISYPKSEHHIEVVCCGEELPFKKNMFEFVYMWGVFEHFNKLDVVKLLGECNRVLIPNGLLEFSTPDLIAVCKIIIEERLPFSYPPIDLEDIKFRRTSIINYALSCLYGNNPYNMTHKYCWYKESLDCELEKSGFCIVTFDKLAYEPETHLHYIVKKT